MSKPLQLHFGIWEDSIYTQLKNQGVKVDRKTAAIWDKITGDIVRLNFRGILSDAESDTAHKRLSKVVSREISKTTTRHPAAKGRKGL